MPSKTPQIALDIINREKEKRTGVLNLNNCGLTEWPKEIFEMKWLEKLIISENELKVIPRLLMFTNLNELNICKNLLENINSIGLPSCLEKLAFENNLIMSITLFEMPNLREVYGSYNMINSVTIDYRNNQLKILGLANNHIINIDFLNFSNSIEVLNLSHNQITGSLDLMKCIKLYNLNVSYNEISFIALPNSIKIVEAISNKIDNLFINGNAIEELNLDSNSIHNIEFIKDCIKIKRLNLNNNLISKLSSLDNLKELEVLNLMYNKINKIENLDGLEKLNNLNLDSNNLRELSGIKNIPIYSLGVTKNFITKLFSEEVINHKTLKRIYFLGNPLIDYIDSTSHVEFTRDLEIWRKELFNFELNSYYKICLVGDGRSGKSSLLDRLERNTFDPNKDSSHGIIIDYSENWKDIEGNPATIQYWDFGGQDLYHGTHKWFLKGDHLNLLVWNKNKEEDSNPQYKVNNLQYWLSICDRCNTNNKVLITQTKKEMDGLGIPDEFDLLKEKYNLINNIVHIDSKPDDPKINNIDALRAAIQNHLSNSPILNQKIPLSYHKVRSKIIEKSKKEVEIDFDEFRAVCKDCGVGEFTDFDKSCNLCLHWLQVSGVVFYNEHILSSRIIIDQKWAIDAVYKAFDRTSELYETITKNQGRFLLSELYAELEAYSEHERQRVLDYLQSSYTIFEVGYNYYKTPEERTFICPRFLPNVDANKISESLSLRTGRTLLKSENYFDSDFDDIISVLGQKGFLNPDYIYKNCVLLEDKNERYLLYKDNNGHPEILGHSNFDGLFRPFSATLSDIGLNFTYSSVEGIMVTREYEPKEVVDLSIKIFVSYAHGYQEASDLFINKLINFLCSSATYEIKIWSDHDIFLGEDWHNRIQTQIKRSDLSILLLSDDFFNSKYIKNNEMNVFIDQQRESGYPFVPIYFSPCEYKDWEAIKKSQLFKPDKDDFEEVNSKDFAFTSLLYKGPTLVDGAENSPNVNYYFKMLRMKLEEVFMNIKK
ncbi:MAG: TIR domain-containing protein [Saprospiraceae bacterium]|nr:TIR domain-containing protein [Saprospiraceae bacterium]